MKGQSGLIAVVIMVGVTLVIGMAALAYYSTVMSKANEMVELQKMISEYGASIRYSVYYSDNTSAVVMVTSSEPVSVFVSFAGVKGRNLVYMTPVEEYMFYVPASPTPSLTSLSGWVAEPMNMLSGRFVVVDPASMMYAPDTVVMGFISKYINATYYPFVFRVTWNTNKDIDTGVVLVGVMINNRVYILQKIKVP